MFSPGTDARCFGCESGALSESSFSMTIRPALLYGRPGFLPGDETVVIDLYLFETSAGKQASGRPAGGANIARCQPAFVHDDGLILGQRRNAIAKLIQRKIHRAGDVRLRIIFRLPNIDEGSSFL